eukprot:TRINITY_DN4943_c0_g2_i1.p1 TRINITY_DN4943_c0_g2~~TRINITY_DN4943_c0_g2_i1.p1  ORF type:complete len:261 (-),score=16.40 TRINITY_DN4943_c0_g2_i1:459-1241(-)
MEYFLQTLRNPPVIVVNVMAVLMIVNSVCVFFSLKLFKAPYGRYSQNASKWWGPDIPAKVAWVIQEFPSVACAMYFLACVRRLDITTNSFLIFLFGVHYFQRTFIFPMLIRGGKPTKLVPFLLALVFCSYNGYMQCSYLAIHFIQTSSVLLVVGSLVFCAGMYINIQSDGILRNLRKPGETGHKIPYGGMFEYVSAANFFGEILEWAGFAIASGFALPPVAFAIFTFSNIGPRGRQHHQNYLEKFEDYPRNRKAVIPFLW